MKIKKLPGLLILFLFVNNYLNAQHTAKGITNKAAENSQWVEQLGIVILIVSAILVFVILLFGHAKPTKMKKQHFVQDFIKQA